MDQLKTGAFIAALRKEKGMTQKDLADILSISDRTVSRWETGSGMPEVSLMLPLCNELGITVNELLMAERIPAGDMEKSAEKLMMELVSEREENRKRIIIALITGSITIGTGILCITAAVLLGFTSAVRTFFIILGLITVSGGAGVCLALDCKKNHL